jgi:hypothetical protein
MYSKFFDAHVYTYPSYVDCSVCDDFGCGHAQQKRDLAGGLSEGAFVGGNAWCSDHKNRKVE